MGRLQIIPIGLFAILGALWLTAAADETSTGDKLRILYSNQFTFTDSGIPLVTIELSSGASELRLRSEHGVLVRPDGDGGSEIDGGTEWTIQVEHARPALIHEWTVVKTLGPDDDNGAAEALSLWQRRGFEVRRFEIGTVFGVDGEVIDTRDVRIGVSPKPAPQGGREARRIAEKFSIETEVHRELVRRPQGTLVARSGATVVRNPSVIWFAPRGREGTLTLDDVEVGGGGSQLRTKREPRSYFGRIYVTIGRDGKLTAVNAVSADRLLAGLVPSEICPDAPPEALAAQAIAARTELLQKIGTRHLTDPYLLCSNQHCQVYSGAGHEHPRTTRAVAQTRGRVLVRAGGGLVDARYSAACGGHSEHNEHIWGGSADPSLRGHLDTSAPGAWADAFAHGIDNSNIKQFLNLPSKSSFCGTTRYGRGRFRWKKTVSAVELERRVAAHYRGVGRPYALEPIERGVSGRIKSLRIRGKNGTAIARGDLHIRRLLGGLRSSLFVVRPVGAKSSPSAFEFQGAGFGHGVGMCQIGAIGMAESGKSHRTILNHYYTGSRIKRLY